MDGTSVFFFSPPICFSSMRMRSHSTHMMQRLSHVAAPTLLYSTTQHRGYASFPTNPFPRHPAHPSTASTSSFSAVDPADLFRSTFRDSGSAASGSQPTSVEAVFARQFGSQTGWAKTHAATTQMNAAAATAAAEDTGAYDSSYSRNAATAASADRHNTPTQPWSGLRTVLSQSQHAASPSQPHPGATTSTPMHYPATHPIHSTVGGTPHTHAAAAASSPPSSSSSSFSSPPPSPLVQRYWHSYRLWQYVHRHVQQEGGILEAIRAQMRHVKAEQRVLFQAQLRNTTRWTALLVMPLLSILWVSIFFDTVVYRAEVMLLKFVPYDAALREYEAANSKDRVGRMWKGSKKDKEKKKGNIRID